MPYNQANDPNLGNNYQGSRRKGSRATKGAVVAPNDTTDLAAYASGLVTCTAGNVVILPSQNADGATITFTGLAAGVTIPFQVRRVLATGTTATVASLDG